MSGEEGIRILRPMTQADLDRNPDVQAMWNAAGPRRGPFSIIEAWDPRPAPVRAMTVQEAQRIAARMVASGYLREGTMLVEGARSFETQPLTEGEARNAGWQAGRLFVLGAADQITLREDALDEWARVLAEGVRFAEAEGIRVRPMLINWGAV